MSKKTGFPISFVLTSVLCLMWGTIAQAKDKPITLDTDPNLAGWWKLDEVSGKTAADSSKHNRKGTLKEDMSFEENSASGRVAKALKFDGGDDYIEITKYKGVTGTRPRTVAAWLRTTTTRGEIISWGYDDFGQMFTFGFVRGRIGIRPNGGYLYINDAVHDDEWHHVAAVVEEVELPNLHDDVKLYKDGEPAEIHDIGLLDLWPIDTGKELDVRIGRRFKGLIDDVRIYDRALSEDEINALYKLQSNQPLPKSKKN
ncbi:MAG: LamG domain-containing protein [Planctomycetes bacterium]|nr:LamG domain-containing protein [Planctomycetota bacterium]